jgi:hypothetical protein
MKELGITMDFKSQVDNHRWDHISNDDINHLQGARTLRLQKLDNSIAKEPVRTHAKCATWMLDTKDKK